MTSQQTNLVDKNQNKMGDPVRPMAILEEDTIQEEDEEEAEHEAQNELQADLKPQHSGDLRIGAAAEERLRRRVRQEKEEEDADTDLELEEEKPEFDPTGKATYLQVCRVLGVLPVSYFLNRMTERHLSLAHHGLGAYGMKALSYPLMNNTYIITLDLEDNWLGPEGGEAASCMLKENCYITDLNLSNNKLGSQGCAAIFQVLQSNVTLKSLNLAGNDFNDNEARSIAEAFLENSTLKSVNLSHNDFGQTDTTVLADAISENETIEHLDLSWNHFRRKSAKSLLDGIATNSRLRSVNLAMNGLDNEATFGIADILRQSGTVTHVDVSHNRIGVTGAAVIGKALEGNDLLKSLKIGYNPLGVEGVKLVFHGVCPEASCVVELDFSGIGVDREFRDLKEELQKARSILVLHGPVLSDYIIKPKRKPPTQLFGVPVAELSSDSVMAAIVAFCSANNVTLYEKLLKHDVNGDNTAHVQDFAAAFAAAGQPLSNGQCGLLEELLGPHANDEGFVDFSFLK